MVWTDQGSRLSGGEISGGVTPRTLFGTEFVFASMTDCVSQIMWVFLFFVIIFMCACACVCTVLVNVSGTHVTSCPEFLLTVVNFFTKGIPRDLEKPELRMFDTGATAADGHCRFVLVLSVEILGFPGQMISFFPCHHYHHHYHHHYQFSSVLKSSPRASHLVMHRTIGLMGTIGPLTVVH